jgi:hypothetical protein
MNNEYPNVSSSNTPDPDPNPSHQGKSSPIDLNRIDWMKLDPIGPEYWALRQQVMSTPWWGYEEVGIYIRKSCGAAKIWMHRNNVRKCATDRSKTCKEWVDAALNRRS